MNLRNVFALCGLFLLLGCEPANSTSDSIIMDDNGHCGYSGSEEDFCASYCFKTVKPYLAFTIALKEQITEKDSEIKELRKQLLEISDQIKVKNQRIENLGKTIEDLLETNDGLRKSVKQQNQIAKIEEFITNTISNQTAEIEDLKLKVANGEKNSQKLQQVEKDLIVCKEKLPKDSCRGLPSGIHIISISGLDPFAALCNGDIADGSGWMVIHRRFDGSENFQRNWTDFRNGFGSLEKEFFIGLELLHRITYSGQYELYVEIKYFNETIKFARYDSFKIGNEDSKYELESLGKYEGTAPNRMLRDLHQKFSTIDQDNDNREYENCAAMSGASWYDNCWGPNFNGRYYNYEIYKVDTVRWLGYDSLKSTQMLIRPMTN